MATSSEAKTTSDHDEIRRWTEARGGQPACVKGTGDEGDVGMLRIDFPGYGGEESLQHISWDDWFQKFDERGLALLHQEMTAGGAQSNFNKLVSREPAEERPRRTAAKRAVKKAAQKAGSKVAAKKAAAKKTKAVAKKATKKKAVAKKATAKKVVARKTVGKRATRTPARAKKTASRGRGR